ncbi:carboxypeptidase-like regulatory domain-containing protein, partial [Sphingobacterium lactis]|uniref:carboxypeptidase-like regulatory domain-containing protein n=1 Tax=Sphingobacterium lactis TaxID=797291 RepID=UPI003DA29A84
MKHFYLTLLFLLTCTLVFGQTATIRGKVQSTGGKAIAKATVRLEGTKIVSVTNEDGGYELKEVPYGQQHIVVTSVEI